MKQLKWMKAASAGIVGLLALSFIVPEVMLHAQEEQRRGESYADQSGLYLSLDEDGNVSYINVDRDTYEVDPQGMNFKDEKETPEGIGGAVTPNSVVNFNYRIEYTSDGGEIVKTYYSNQNKTGNDGYVAGSYVSDAAYIQTSSDGKMVQFKLGGVTAWIDASKVDIVPLSSVKSKSRYRVIEGRIFHDITTNIYEDSYASSVLVGYKQDYMNNGDVFYSYDGHYFYKDYTVMLSDYRSGNFKNAVNATNPYYNYYQFLSHRTSANFSADDYNARVKAVIGDQASKMQGLGSAFVQAQNENSVNAALVFGLACNESGWGRSKIAMNKNNIFGHNAVDSDPANQANSYENPTQSILSHAKVWVADGYIYPGDWRYNGPHFGDKLSGMNVEYASDPYWGEKAAAQGYYLDMKAGVKDYGRYTIGILNQSIDLNIRQQANTTSSVLYGTGNGTLNQARPVECFPFVILDEVSGTSVNGNTTWYKIMSDAVLNSGRTTIETRSGGVIKTKYDLSRDYGFASSVYISKANLPVNPNTPDDSYVKGDVNGNGKIDAADYLMVMDTILGKYSMSDKQKKAGDVNGNGKIDAADYLMIMDCILGKITIK